MGVNKYAVSNVGEYLDEARVIIKWMIPDAPEKSTLADSVEMQKLRVSIAMMIQTESQFIENTNKGAKE